MVEKLDDLIENMSKVMEKNSKENIFIYGNTKFKDPLVVNAISFRGTGLKRFEQAQYVAVRPVDDQKTYLGIYLGDVCYDLAGRYHIESKEILISTGLNPLIFIPDLMITILGAESWWGLIESENDLKKITDADIQNIWYVRALKAIAEKGEKQNE